MTVQIKIDAHNGVLEFEGPLSHLPQAGEAFKKLCPWAVKVSPMARWQAEHDKREADARAKRLAKLHRSVRGVFNLYSKAYVASAHAALNDNGSPEDPHDKG